MIILVNAINHCLIHIFGQSPVVPHGSTVLWRENGFWNQKNLGLNSHLPICYLNLSHLFTNSRSIFLLSKVAANIVFNPSASKQEHIKIVVVQRVGLLFLLKFSEVQQEGLICKGLFSIIINICKIKTLRKNVIHATLTY